MSIEKIERLEELVALTLEVLNNLRTEKTSLEQQVRELKKEKKAALKENEEAKGSLEKLKQLKTSQRKLEKDRSDIRLKVQNALQKIEKMDFFWIFLNIMESQEIKIYGKIYKVKPVSSSVNMQEVATVVDAKIKELSGVKGRSSTVDLAVLTALNLGHELMELKDSNQADDDQLNKRLDCMIQQLNKSLKVIKNKSFFGG